MNHMRGVCETILLSIPGHATDRLKPLDFSFFKPLLTYFHQARAKLMLTNQWRIFSEFQLSHSDAW
jgi:hypothetical protein